jgi:hypothetical protein
MKSVRNREQTWPLPVGGFRLQASPILASGRSTESRPAAARHKLPQQKPASSTYIWWANASRAMESCSHRLGTKQSTIRPIFQRKGRWDRVAQREGGKYKQANPNTLQFTPPIYSKRPGRYERMTTTPWRVAKNFNMNSRQREQEKRPLGRTWSSTSRLWPAGQQSLGKLAKEKTR